MCKIVNWNSVSHFSVICHEVKQLISQHISWFRLVYVFLFGVRYASVKVNVISLPNANTNRKNVFNFRGRQFLFDFWFFFSFSEDSVWISFDFVESRFVYFIVFVKCSSENMISFSNPFL